jgi:hypothetical protein
MNVQRTASMTSPAASLTILLLAACSGAPSQKIEVIVTTEPAANTTSLTQPTPEKNPPVDTNEELKALLMKDESRAANILKASVCDGDREVAAWAAVYALRLGIKHDAACAAEALALGVGSDDLLLRTLSWRWMERWPASALPDWETHASDDPVVRIMAARAYCGKGVLPEALQAALRLPQGEPRGPDRREEAEQIEARLRALSQPFDDGPLWRAVAFNEARFREQSETTADGALIWSATRLLGDGPELFTCSQLLDEQVNNSGPSPASPTSSIGERLENPLVVRPLDVLRAIVLSGADEIKQESLRAIAIISREPLAGDFAAAAAAFTSDNQMVRIEAARTFLLLALRAQQ